MSKVFLNKLVPENSLYQTYEVISLNRINAGPAKSEKTFVSRNLTCVVLFRRINEGKRGIPCQFDFSTFLGFSTSADSMRSQKNEVGTQIFRSHFSALSGMSEES